jgi:hypothetical protein
MLPIPSRRRTTAEGEGDLLAGNHSAPGVSMRDSSADTATDVRVSPRSYRKGRDDMRIAIALIAPAALIWTAP